MMTFPTLFRRSRRPPYRQLPRLPGSSYANAHERALLAALQQRREPLLVHLLEQIGPQAFAQTLAQLPAPHRIQALYLLPDSARTTVCAQLPAQVSPHWSEWQLFLLRRVWTSVWPTPAAKQ